MVKEFCSTLEKHKYYCGLYSSKSYLETYFTKEVLDKSHYLLSFSSFTFPHQLFKLILLEQIFRAYKILNNETYNK